MLSTRSFLKTLTLTAGGLWVPSAFASVRTRRGYTPKPKPVQAAAPAASYIFSENFEDATNGYENSNTTYGDGTINFKDTTNALKDAQSLSIVASATLETRVMYSTTSNSEVYFYFRYKRLVAQSTSARKIFQGYNAGGSMRFTINVQLDGRLQVYHTGVSASTVGVIGTGMVHVWSYYKAGTGSDGIAWVGFSTDGTKPTSGNNYVQLTNGTGTDAIASIRCVVEATASGMTNVWDSIRLSTSSIGDNPVP